MVYQSDTPKEDAEVNYKISLKRMEKSIKNIKYYLKKQKECLKRIEEYF